MTRRTTCRSRRAIAALFAAALLVRCKPDLADRPSLVTSPRVLAVRADPAEGPPGGNVTYRVLVATPDGTDGSPAARWAFCRAPKALTDDAVASAACLTGADVATFGAAAGAATASAPTPTDACALFGPEPSSAGLRPRDPDDTGGFYQPVVVRAPGAPPAIALARIACRAAGAGADVVAAFAAAYVPNRAPTLAPLAVSRDRDHEGQSDVDGGAIDPSHVPPGARVRIDARWGEDDAETYARIDPATQSLVFVRESLRASWFATAGAFDDDHTGRAADDPATATSNVWTAPAAAGTAHLWVVLRDARGGIDFTSLDLVVAP